MDKWIDHITRILSDAEIIQAVPAPTFKEQDRAALILEKFEALGLQNTEIDQTGNVLGFLPGGDQKPLVLSAHLDTVHAKSVDHTITKHGPKWKGAGLGDNTIALATLLETIRYFQEKQKNLPGGIWFAANIAEEGLGDLKGIRTIVDRFQDNVQGYIVLEGMGLGVVFFRGLGVKRYRVNVQTKGGHSWGDYGNPSAVHEIAKFVSDVLEMEIPRTPRSSLNIGRISGGTTINSIAKSADCEIDLRSIDPEILDQMERTILKMVHDRNKRDVRLQAVKIGDRPFGELPSDHWLVQLAEQALYQVGVKPILATGSTDANYPLSLGYPAVCVCITKGGRVHTVDEYIELQYLEKGFRQLLFIIENLWRLQG